MSTEHVDLDRRFRKAARSADAEELAVQSYTLEVPPTDEVLRWDELLRHRRVVVLGEPGSGKTHEFLRKKKDLEDRGLVSFFIRLDRLVAEGLEETLEPGEKARLRSWQRDGGEAFFFLDSVDESKRVRQEDFSTALGRVRTTVQPGLHRATIVLSSRISEWRPKRDRFEFATYLPNLTGKEGDGENQPKPLVTVLEPLDPERVEKLGQGLGMPNVSEFVDDLSNCHAWPFARRPLDVIELINHWNQKGTFGSLRDLVQFDISTKLRENYEREREDDLCEADRVEGSETLGAAVVLCGKMNFNVADAPSIDGPSGMNAGDCLPASWGGRKTAALLNRALFDDASLGMVRFHHRRVAEFLAAEWFKKRVSDGCPLEGLKEIFVEDTASESILRPSLAPVAAWLACGDEEWQHEFRTWLLNSDPTVFLEYGDPNCLPISYKEKTVRRIAGLYRERDRAWISTDDEALARLADTNLASVFEEYISDSEVSTDVRALFLQIIRYGGLRECLRLSIDVITNTREPERLKHLAAVAIRDAGSDEDKRELASALVALDSVSVSLGAILCEGVYPAVVEPDTLLSVFEKIRQDEGGKHASTWSFCRLMEESMRPGDEIPLLKGLLGLSQNPPFDREGDRTLSVSHQFRWAGDVVLSSVRSILNRERVDEALSEVCAECLLLLWHDKAAIASTSLRYEGIADQLKNHVGVIRSYCWARVASLLSEKSPNQIDTWDVFGDFLPFRLAADDLGWLCDDIQVRESLSEKRVALGFAIEIWRSHGCPWKAGWKIRSSARSAAGLRSDFEQLVKKPFVFESFRCFWRRRIQYPVSNWRYRRRRFKNMWTTATQNARDQFRLWRHINDVRLGKPAHWLASLAMEAHRDDIYDRLTPSSWDNLRKKRGRLIACATRSGCKRLWRRYVPELPHEARNPDQTSNGVIAGLAGIAAAVEDGDLEFDSMSKETVQLAARYAIHELNGFPHWFYEMFNYHQSAIQGVLEECIRGEWQQSSDRPEAKGVISKLRWHGRYLVPAISESILAALTASDPRRPQVLEDALSILLQLPDPPVTKIAALASVRTPATAPDVYAHLLWLALWIQVDCGAALDYLEQLLQTAEDPDGIVESVAAYLSGRGPSGGLYLDDPDYLALENLERLIPLLFSHIRTAEDELHSDGRPFSPSVRDDAQDFRGRVVGHLGQCREPAAEDLLLRLREEPSLSDRRDWIDHRIDVFRRNSCDHVPWKPRDIRQFKADFSKDPQTDSDLFIIVKRRLSDVRYSVERADISARGDLHLDSDEAALRSWLARQLRTASRGKYTVPQENEIDLAERPDLRVEAPGLNPVHVEVKWADNWSGPLLMDRLEIQLIGQYLRARDARYGVFLLGYKGKKRRWRSPHEDRQIELQELVRILQERANQVVLDRTHIQGVHVMSISFADPRV